MKQSLVKRFGFGLLLVCAWALLTDVAFAQRGGGFGGGGFGGGGFGGGGFGGGAAGTGANAPVGTADISVDQETRNLVIVTDEKTADYIKQVVSSLDRPAPQVLIKVVFLEASYTKGSDIGLEGIYTKSFGGGNMYTGIVSQVFGNSLVSKAPTLAAPGAGLYSILGSDFQATLRAIAQAGKTEILSRPSILTRNNQQAIISLGQQVPLITATRFDTLGNQINTVTYQNVGIILQVTPFITSDGMVEMIVAPQTSVLADRSQWVPISSGTGGTISAPVINSRSAQTVVVVPDGQTVVIGGLMENQKLESESKIPILGDIPGLGALFKRKIKDNVKRELIIFLTPYIVTHPSQLAKLSATETSDSQFMKKPFSEPDLNRMLESLQTKNSDSSTNQPPSNGSSRSSKKRK